MIKNADTSRLEQARFIIEQFEDRSLNRLNRWGEITESFDNKFGYISTNPFNMDPDLIRERKEWGFAGAQATPYSDLDQALYLQMIGWELFNKCPTVISCTSKLISYILGDGVTYTVTEKKFAKPKAGKKLIADLDACVEYLTGDELGWYEYQIESLQRYITHGEPFRKVRTKDDDKEYIRYRFVEPHHVRPPSDNQAALKEDPFGVRFDKDDKSEPIEYWVKGFRQPIPVSKLQHCKSNVWSCFPRGLPLFWTVYCHSVGTKEISHAMRELALVQSAYAVIRKHGENSAASKIAALSAGVLKKKDDENNGRPVPGLEVDSKGYEWEFPNHSVNAGGFVDIIKADQNFIGLVADMADYMSTGDSDQGAKASLIVAGDPFHYRVKRERRLTKVKDINFIWMAIQALKGWSDEEVSRVRKSIRIEAEYPEIPTMQSEGKVAEVIQTVSAGLRSKEQGRAELDIDHDQAEEQIDDERESEPLVTIDTNSGAENVA